MRFENAAMLYLLVLPLAAVGALIFGIWLRRRTLRAFGNAQTLEGQLERPSPYLRAVKAIALVVGVAGIVLAAARPQYGGRIRMLKKRGIDVVVALDFSKSMLAQDVQPSRLDRAKLELNEFINQLTGDRIGLVAFAGDTMRFPLTTDYAAATAFWKDLGPYDMPVGGTAIGKAITAATRMLIPENQGEAKKMLSRSKAIVLITDGEDHFGDPLEAAKEAGGKGIAIYVLGIGSDSPELIPRYLDDGTTMGYQKTNDGEYVTTALSPENEETLRDIAASTSGRYFRAGNDLGGMTQVVQEIRKMKQSDIESRQQEVYEDVFQWFLIPAFVLLVLAFVLPDRLAGLRRKSRSLSPAVLGLFFVLLPATLPDTAAAWELFKSKNSEVSKGNALLKEGKAGEALEAYDQAARALPNRGAVHVNRGLALNRMGEEKLDQAMQAFKMATDTSTSDSVRARAHFNLGNAFYKKEDFPEAVRQYKQSLLLEPGNKDAAWNLEIAKRKQKEKEEQQKKDQEKQDQQNQDQQDQDKQDQDQQNQDQQNQDQQKQDQDQQKQDDQKKEEKKKDEQGDKKEQQKKEKEQQKQQQQEQQQPKTRQEVEQLLNSLDKQDDDLQKQMAKRKGVAVQAPRSKDW